MFSLSNETKPDGAFPETIGHDLLLKRLIQKLEKNKDAGCKIDDSKSYLSSAASQFATDSLLILFDFHQFDQDFLNQVLLSCVKIYLEKNEKDKDILLYQFKLTLTILIHQGANEIKKATELAQQKNDKLTTQFLSSFTPTMRWQILPNETKSNYQNQFFKKAPKVILLQIASFLKPLEQLQLTKIDKEFKENIKPVTSHDVKQLVQLSGIEIKRKNLPKDAGDSFKELFHFQKIKNMITELRSDIITKKCKIQESSYFKNLFELFIRGVHLSVNRKLQSDQMDLLKRFLVTAIIHNHTPSALALLQCGVNPNLKTPLGVPLLTTAVCHMNEDLVLALVLSGADVNAVNNQKRTVLMEAASIANQVSETRWYFLIFKIIQILMTHLARLDLTDDDGNTVWFHIAEYGHIVLRDFLHAFSDASFYLNMRNYQGETPFLSMLKKYAQSRLDQKNNDKMTFYDFYYRYLLPLKSQPIQLDAEDKKGNTALIIAVKTNDPALVKYLLAKGASPHYKNSKRKIALDYTDKQTNKEIVDVLKSEMIKHHKEPEHHRCVLQ